mmetsp:Transcript_24393/g.41440  ORF Transcript_24393/g.41440 Transcript_24393/m.41440 type:complete len:93 (-) Transcript_24393:977-1255(-)
MDTTRGSRVINRSPSRGSCVSTSAQPNPDLSKKMLDVIKFLRGWKNVAVRVQGRPKTCWGTVHIAKPKWKTSSSYLIVVIVPLIVVRFYRLN